MISERPVRLGKRRAAQKYGPPAHAFRGVGVRPTRQVGAAHGPGFAHGVQALFRAAELGARVSPVGRPHVAVQGLREEVRHRRGVLPPVGFVAMSVDLGRLFLQRVGHFNARRGLQRLAHVVRTRQPLHHFLVLEGLQHLAQVAPIRSVAVVCHF